MGYKYSTCYPDIEEITYYDDSISANQVFQIMSNFDWTKELSKEIVYYSPSLDFVNLVNRKRIIFSGIGKNRLEQFQVMFIEPSELYSSYVFDADNYKDTDSYSKDLEKSEAIKVLQYYLDKKYDLIKELLTLDPLMPVEMSDQKEINALIDQNQINYDDAYMNPILKWFLRISAPFISIFFFVFGYEIYRFSNEINILSILLIGFGILLVVATFKVWQQTD